MKTFNETSEGCATAEPDLKLDGILLNELIEKRVAMIIVNVSGLLILLLLVLSMIYSKPSLEPS